MHTTLFRINFDNISSFFIQAYIRTSLDGLHDLLGDLINFKWIRQRLDRMDEIWVKAAIKLQKELGDYNLKRKRVSTSCMPFAFSKYRISPVMKSWPCFRYKTIWRVENWS